MGFSLSVQSNPALDGTKDMNMMIRLLDKLDILLKLGIRSTILELMKVAAKFDDPAIFQVSPSYEEVTMDLLAGGHNEGFAVLAKVLYLVNNEKIYPLYYVLCDTKLDCFILTVHGIHEMAIRNLLHIFNVLKNNKSQSLPQVPTTRVKETIEETDGHQFSC